MKRKINNSFFSPSTYTYHPSLFFFFSWKLNPISQNHTALPLGCTDSTEICQDFTCRYQRYVKRGCEGQQEMNSLCAGGL